VLIALLQIIKMGKIGTWYFLLGNCKIFFVALPANKRPLYYTGYFHSIHLSKIEALDQSEIFKKRARWLYGDKRQSIFHCV